MKVINGRVVAGTMNKKYSVLTEGQALIYYVTFNTNNLTFAKIVCTIKENSIVVKNKC
jgi:hypothetical protein